MNATVVALLTHLAQSLGSLGCAMGIRIALLPLTIRLARRAHRNQERMRVLQPELDQLKKRFEKRPERLFDEMSKLYRKHDCSPFDIPTWIGSFVQLPIFGILYSGIRSSLGPGGAFLWIKSLAAPDFLLTLVILTVTGVSTCLMPSASEQMKGTLIVIQVVVTFFIVWKLAAGLGLYWASSSLVGLFQTLWLRFRKDAQRMA